jgi:hypothetical protein
MATNFALILDLLLRANPNMSWTKFIIICVATIVAIVVAFIFLMGRFKSGTAPLWTKLAPVINGRLKMSNWTYSGTKLNGSYNGLPLVAWVDYDKQIAVGAPGVTHKYFFAVEGMTGARGSNWNLRRSYNNQGSEIQADAPLQQRFYQADILSVAQDWPAQASAAYNARHGALRLRMPIQNERALPTPDIFKHQLEALLSLANINGQVNVY